MTAVRRQSRETERENERDITCHDTRTFSGFGDSLELSEARLWHRCQSQPKESALILFRALVHTSLFA